MPRAADVFLNGALPLSHNPLDRISTQPPKTEFDLEAIIEQVKTFIEDFLFPAIQDLTGLDLSALLPIIDGFTGFLEAFSGAFGGIDVLNPASILAAITSIGGNIIQQVIDAILGGITGGTSTGNDPASIALAFANQVLALPITALDQIFGLLAALQGQVTAVQNAPGTVLTDDFATTGVGGYTNITGTIAVSASGPYVQTPNLSVAYRNTGPSTDKHGAQITIDGNMNGVCGVAICSDTGATNYAELQVYSGFSGDSVRLVTGSAPDLVVVQKQADFITPRAANTNVFDIWYEPGINTFHLLRNGQFALDWIDSTNIVTHGGTKRRVLLRSNGSDRDDNGFYGPGVRKLTAYDKA